jgi:phosphate transport system substrate-binding protein
LLAWILAVVPAGAETIRVGGTGSALGPLRLLAQAFRKVEPEVTVEVLPSLGSSGAIKAVRDGAIEIGASARLLKDDEKKPGFSFFEMARTPLVLVTNPGVGVKGMTAGELARIYRGEIREWNDGRRLRLVIRPSTEADTAIIRGLSAEMDAAAEDALAHEGQVFSVTDQEAAEFIEKTPGAIGFLTLGQVRSEARAVRIVDLDGVGPDLTALAAGRYPLEKRLYLLTRGEPSSGVRHFVEFIRSPEGDRILRETGLLPSSAGK